MWRKQETSGTYGKIPNMPLILGWDIKAVFQNLPKNWPKAENGVLGWVCEKLTSNPVKYHNEAFESQILPLKTDTRLQVSPKGGNRSSCTLRFDIYSNTHRLISKEVSGGRLVGDFHLSTLPTFCLTRMATSHSDSHNEWTISDLRSHKNESGRGGKLRPLMPYGLGQLFFETGSYRQIIGSKAPRRLPDQSRLAQ